MMRWTSLWKACPWSYRIPAAPRSADGIGDGVIYDEAPTGGPEIALRDNVSQFAVYDGLSAVYVGVTEVGTPLTRTFTILNQGGGELSLSPLSLSLPPGFSLVDTFPDSVPAYSSTSFAVQLDATAAGSYGGKVSFRNNDSDENPFDFVITGQVVGEDGPPSTVEVFIEDVVVEEGDGTAFFRVALSEPAPSDITVKYQTSPGTTQGASDFQATSGILQFSTGDTEKTVTVTLVDDTEIEEDEYFTVSPLRRLQCMD